MMTETPAETLYTDEYAFRKVNPKHLKMTLVAGAKRKPALRVKVATFSEAAIAMCDWIRKHRIYGTEVKNGRLYIGSKPLCMINSIGNIYIAPDLHSNVYVKVFIADHEPRVDETLTSLEAAANLRKKLAEVRSNYAQMIMIQSRKAAVKELLEAVCVIATATYPQAANLDTFVTQISRWTSEANKRDPSLQFRLQYKGGESEKVAFCVAIAFPGSNSENIPNQDRIMIILEQQYVQVNVKNLQEQYLAPLQAAMTVLSVAQNHSDKTFITYADAIALANEQITVENLAEFEKLCAN